MSENSKKEIMEKLQEIVRTIVDSEDIVDGLNDETNLLTDLGFDSIMLVQLVAEIEDVYGITFSNEDMDVEKLYKCSELVDIIKKYV